MSKRHARSFANIRSACRLRSLTRLHLAMAAINNTDRGGGDTHNAIRTGKETGRSPDARRWCKQTARNVVKVCWRFLPKTTIAVKRPGRRLAKPRVFAYIRAMKSIDGRKLAQQLRDELARRIAEHHLTPKLGVILVGDDAASHLYVSLKEKAAHAIGIATDVRRLPVTTTDAELIQIIEAWNADATIHGILVQLPLPAGHDTDAVIRAIDPKKDVDGFHPENLTALTEGRATILSPVHEGILRLIASTGTTMNTAKAVIIAKSDIFAKPLEYLLRKAGAFVTILPPDQLDRQTLLTAQILISAVGKHGTLSRTNIPAGAVVIDVGTTKDADGHTVGDVDASQLSNLDGYLSPVPGGVGPMTIALLLKNVVILAQR